MDIDSQVIIGRVEIAAPVEVRPVVVEAPLTFGGAPGRVGPAGPAGPSPVAELAALGQKIDDDIEAEAAARAAGDSALSISLQQDIADARDGLLNLIAGEAMHRQVADNIAQASISNEVIRATAAEGVLQIAIAAETARATAEETLIQSDLTSEVRERSDADAALQSAIDAISELIASNDTSLDELQEIVNFIKANRADIDALGINSIIGLADELNSLSARISVEADRYELITDDHATRLRAVEDTTAAHALALPDLQAGIDVERSQRDEADALLADSVTTEIARAEAAEAALAGRLDTAENTISAHALDLTNLGDNLTTESIDRVEDVARLNDRVENEELARASAVTEVADNLVSGLATKANLTGGNTFTGTQTFNDNAEVGGNLDVLGAFTAADVVATKPAGITGASAVSNLVQISQADYDALGTKDASTIYLIVG